MTQGLINRRHMLLGSLGAATLGACSNDVRATGKAKIVIVGGGYGGATAARTLSQLLPNALISLVDSNDQYTSCPFSNLYLTQNEGVHLPVFERNFRKHSTEFIRAKALRFDASRKTVELDTGQNLDYDRLILSPGIAFDFDAIEGYSESTTQKMPHAWKAGAQTHLLREQLQNMKDGATFVISVPEAPYRCPPGPYERASLIAHYMKTHKPRSKLIILDSKDNFSKKDLFQEAWAEHYSKIIEWRGVSDDGRVVRVDPEAMTVHTDFEDIKAGVANIIPPQRASDMARDAGTNDSGWVEVNGMTFETIAHKDVYVIGDAAMASPMPKSAFAANQQAKICAIAVASSLLGLPVTKTTLANTCYSFVTPNEAVSISAVYNNAGGGLTKVEGAGGLTPLNAQTSVRNTEAAQARDWFRAVTQEAFG